MGLIKTAMMSGVAIYGVNQIAKTAAKRPPHNNNSRGSPSPPHQESRRRYYADEDLPYYYCDAPPQQPRRHPNQDQRSAPQYTDQRDAYAGPYNPPPPPPRRQYSEADNSYNNQDYVSRNDDRKDQQYRYADPMTPPPYNDYYAGPQQRQRGYVEPEDQYSDRAPGSSSGSRRMDMVGALAQQAMGSLGGGQKGKDGDDGKGDLLSKLFK